MILLISIFCSAAGNLFLSPLLRLLGVQPGDGLVYEACREYVRVILYGMPVLFSSYLLNYYLRNDNNQNLAVVGFTVGNLSDLGMNILFVLILDMGVLGAAISTVLGQAIAICIYLPGFFLESGIFCVFSRSRCCRFSGRNAFPASLSDCPAPLSISGILFFS